MSGGSSFVSAVSGGGSSFGGAPMARGGGGGGADEAAQLTVLFARWDADADGLLDADDFMAMIKGHAHDFGGYRLSTAEARVMFRASAARHLAPGAPPHLSLIHI